MADVVLDSFALVAYFRDEPGAEAVEELLLAAERRQRPLHMSEVNYAEARYAVIRKNGRRAWEEAAEILTGLPIRFHAATRAHAELAAEFKARFKMSLADAFSAALALERKAELVTGDPEFKALESEVRIRWIAKAG